MFTLQIQFYCLCLFVRDSAQKRVHVVMPDTHECHRHLVKLYRVAADNTLHELGRMEGLELVLGQASGTGSADLDSLGLPDGGEVVDLTYVTENASGVGLKAPLELVNETPREVVSRVKVGDGRAVRREAEAYWRFKNERVFMAHTLTWEINNVPDVLVWNRMSGTTAIPLVKLSDLGGQQPLPVDHAGEQKHGYCLLVSHTMGNDVPGKGELNEKAVKEHFRHFYHALGHHRPNPGELPELDCDKRPAERLGKFNCGAALIELSDIAARTQ
ncbi:MAG TPA: hypothetical protein VEY93_00635 [Longimicrobium sp.]|nr:hypothetical protein [Longimicrobium sp.]